MALRHHHYMDPTGGVIRITSNLAPGEKTIPRNGTWVVKEFSVEHGTWVMPCFPEVTWGILKKLTFLGSVKVVK